MPVPFKVRAVYDYKSEEPDDLNFGIGQIITVTDEDDADWYTGEYENTSGKVEGIFPRNFVEKYEPAIPSRPVRSAQKSAQAPSVVAAAPLQLDTAPTSTPQAAQEVKPEPLTTRTTREEETVSRPAAEEKPPISKPAGGKQPPPVTEKPATSSFKDRIAAFNKTAAPPIAPFKPAVGSNASSNFIKKPFVPPPPSRHSYVPPPAQAPAPAKIYRRDEDPEMQRQDEDEEDNDDTTGVKEAPRAQPEVTEDQPKPTSLKDRIALLQQQQLEQAQRLAEKKKVPKKPPPPERTDSASNDLETVEPTEAPLTRQETDHTLNKRSLENEYGADEDEDDTHTPEGDVMLPTLVPPPARELVSDTNDADDSGAGDTEDAQETSTEEDQRRESRVRSPPSAIAEPTKSTHPEAAEETPGEVAGAEEDTEDEDPEIRRRRELRERMAKMSGGMGMMGMFGPPGGIPAPSKKPKPQPPKAEKSFTDPQPEEETTRAPPVPIMALPGMSTKSQRKDVDSDEVESTSPTPMESYQKSAASEDYVSHQPVRTSTDRSGPTTPYERAAPPPPPRDVRQLPPAPPSGPSAPPIPQSPAGRSDLPPPPPPPTRDDTMENVHSPQSPTSGRSSLEHKPTRQASTKKDGSGLPASAPPPPPARRMTSDSMTSNHSASDRRVSRPPPPPPAAVPTQARPPPPPPPGQPPSRSTTGGSRGIVGPGDEVNSESEDEVTEYDGDYDTDIASGAKHKDALKAHNRDSSMEDENLTDDVRNIPSSPPTRAIPPIPPTSPPRDGPPPLPPMSAPKVRKSSEAPKAMPPPIPNTTMSDDEYDPYRHSTSQYTGPPPPPIPQTRSPPALPASMDTEDGDMYGAPSYAPPPMPPPSHQAPPMPVERMPPPPPPSERAVPPPPPHQSSIPMMAGGLGPPPTAPKQSLDVGIGRTSSTARRSAEQNRPSSDFGFMASDIDLAEGSLWWTQENAPPPSIAPRTDVLYEVESNTATKRGGKTTVTRDVYVLYIDYSQTTINVSFDPNDPSSASLSQSHQRPPPPPRQDQLESVSHSFGSKIATAASQAAGSTIADGSAQGFIWTILQPLKSTALMPVGFRSFGATIYSNLANASTQQFDEIRPGDIVTFRNAKFAGHKGGLHAKYSMEAGQPGRDHAAIVIDWDGTKKKIRAWEQGREEKKGSKGKVKEESFRVGDLKSGEVRVWRIMGRSWVGWDSS